MTFGEALALLRTGTHRVARSGWNGKGMYLFMQAGDSNGFPWKQFIVMKTAQDTFVPWTASQTDLLNDDWVEVSNG